MARSSLVLYASLAAVGGIAALTLWYRAARRPLARNVDVQIAEKQAKKQAAVAMPVPESRPISASAEGEEQHERENDTPAQGAGVSMTDQDGAGAQQAQASCDAEVLQDLQEKKIFRAGECTEFVFREAPHAHTVLLTGSFAAQPWTTMIKMTRDVTTGDFHVTVDLSQFHAQAVQYKYIVDGVWTVQRSEACVIDASGHENNERVILL